MTILADGLSSRPARESDVSAITELLAARSLAVSGVVDTDEDEIRSMLTTPDAAGRYDVVLDAAEEVAAFVGLWTSDTSAHVLVIVELGEELVGTSAHEALLSYAALKAEPVAAGRRVMFGAMARDAACARCSNGAGWSWCDVSC